MPELVASGCAVLAHEACLTSPLHVCADDFSLFADLQRVSDSSAVTGNEEQTYVV